MADQLFKKRQGQRKIRKEAVKEIEPYRYLIVCEGEKTEPFYFNGIKKIINEKYGDKIKVEKIVAERIEIDGTGRNTESLVRYALEKKQSAKIPYGHVWCVFDKDSFTDEQFNTSIQMCESNDLGAAWTNEAIELWFLLHFEYLNTGINRHQYIDKLNDYFAINNINNGKYEKNLENIYEILCRLGNQNKAIKLAKKLESEYDDEVTPSKMMPCTQVYKLIEELFEYLNI